MQSHFLIRVIVWGAVSITSYLRTIDFALQKCHHTYSKWLSKWPAFTFSEFTHSLSIFPMKVWSHMVLIFVLHKFQSAASTVSSPADISSSCQQLLPALKCPASLFAPGDLEEVILFVHDKLCWTWPNHLRWLCLRTKSRSFMFSLWCSSCVLLLSDGLMAQIQQSITLSFLSNNKGLKINKVKNK